MPHQIVGEANYSEAIELILISSPIESFQKRLVLGKKFPKDRGSETSIPKLKFKRELLTLGRNNYYRPKSLSK